MPNPYEEIAELKNDQFEFNFSDCIRWLEKTGKRLFGSHFRIYPQDRRLILSLLVYAIADRETTEKQGLNLEKGILLSGPIGCGKTSLMILVNYFFPKSRQYRIKSTREAAFEFEKEGFKVITQYSSKPVITPQNAPPSGVYCFDDLGLEQPMKFFGNQCNVMAEILLSRYDLFISRGIFTHVTTNLTALELESKYGNRIRSRMREMFNLVTFDKDSKDKRI
jgi:energy-coupling factor transporter ATP-binding protein EcfA2